MKDGVVKFTTTSKKIFNGKIRVAKMVSVVTPEVKKAKETAKAK